MVNVRLVLVGLLAAVASVSYACDRPVCAPVVGKCVKSGWCECDRTNYSCCKECFGSLFSKCCDCVDACPKKNETTKASDEESYIDSYVGEIEDPEIKIFNIHVDVGTNLVPLKYPVTFDTEKLKPKVLKLLNLKASQKNSAQEVSSKRKKITLNCTVVYLNECLSWNYCEHTCSAMGAVSYRWFFDGCCECIGDHCNNFGLNESRCKQCPTTPTSSTISTVNTGYDEDTLEIRKLKEITIFD